MIFGILATILLVLLLIKCPARKLGLTKLEQLSRKLHKPVGVIILAVIVLHLLVTLKVWVTRAAAVVVTGVAKVRVTVKGGRMEDITILRHDNERGKPAEAIIPKIMEQ
jgi:uncharacterized protein with FMN-binding domain